MQIDMIWRGPAVLGESPVWDDRADRLLFIDATEGLVIRCAPDGGDLDRWQTGRTIGCLALRDRGGVVLATERGFEAHALTDDGTELLVALDQPAGVRLNDGKVDPYGDLVCGSYDTRVLSASGADRDATPRGLLYRLDAAHRLHMIKTGIGCTNGPCWSPDGREFYVADSWKGTISAFAWHSDMTTLPAEREIVTIAFDKGVPDGAAVDEQGYIWSAIVLGGRIDRYAPDGSLDRSLPMPTPGITSLAFGGADLDILFATSRRGRPDGPGGGALFAVRGLGIRGAPIGRYRG
jgi:sugar lactone lactonase YvrE